MGGVESTVAWLIDGARSAHAPQEVLAQLCARLVDCGVPLTRVAEIWGMRRLATNLLDAYVGHQTGARILAGQIRRCHTEAIRAAIWLSDLRGFTALSDRTPGPVLIGLLNRYFDCQVPPIQAQGGEVLKYMGDGLLAIFPIAGEERDAAAVCGAALAAARAFRSELAQLNAAALRPGAACRRGDVRQHRRRQPAGLHGHRSGR
jgi:class 3 adenylate cyclase